MIINLKIHVEEESIKVLEFLLDKDRTQEELIEFIGIKQEDCDGCLSTDNLIFKPLLEYSCIKMTWDVCTHDSQNVRDTTVVTWSITETGKKILRYALPQMVSDIKFLSKDIEGDLFRTP